MIEGFADKFAFSLFLTLTVVTLGMGAGMMKGIIDSNNIKRNKRRRHEKGRCNYCGFRLLSPFSMFRGTCMDCNFMMGLRSWSKWT